MNRELKFRVWNSDDKKWINDGTKPDASFWVVFCTVEKDQEGTPHPYTYQQHTGLKDKNGKEIYEGDIIKNPNGDLTSVEWDSEEGQWGNTIFAYRPIFRSWEVIGNIFENPELLNETKTQ